MDLGINIWGSDILTNGEYQFPTESQIDYFAAKGFTNIRLTFGWETIQDNLNGPLNADFVSQIHQVVEYAASQGLDVILDVHNYGKYEGSLIGSKEVPVSAFANLWSRIASEFVDDSNVRFGLMNEPQVENAKTWLSAVNSAISAIRATGADQQVLVPGIDWTGAWSWTSGDNAKVIGAPGAIIDPAHNYAFEVHQYLDDTSGQNEWVVSENIGVQRLQAITDWARANGVPLYLGEFGVADNPLALKALDKMMQFLQANDDVWKSASYWVAGTSNPTYMYSVQPDLHILDAPQMDVLEKYTGAKTSVTLLADGTVRNDVYAQDGKIVTLSDIVTKTGELVSRSIFDADGKLSSKAVVSSDGSITVTVYDQAGKSYPYTATVYDDDHKRIQESVADASGAVTVKLYQPGVHDPYQETVYKADGSLDHILKHVDGQHIGETYQNGVLSKIEVYSWSTWKLLSRDTYDASGKLVNRQVDNADGTHDVSTFNTKTGLIQSHIEYTSSWKVSVSTNYDSKGLPTRQVSYEADGTQTVDSYAAGTDKIAKTEYLTADGKLASLTTYSANSQSTTTYAPPGSAKPLSTVVVEDGVTMSKTQYDTKGLVTSIERTQADGGHSVETYDGNHQSHPVSVSSYDAAWKLVSVTSFNDQGQATSVNVAGDNGLNTVTSYVPGTDQITKVEVYVNWKLQSRTSYDDNGKIASVQKDNADGTHEVQNFNPSHQSQPEFTSKYDASWKLVSVTYLDEHGRPSSINIPGDNGINTVTSFVPGTDQVSKVEVYVDWKLQSRTSYDMNGNVASIQKDNADGTHEVQNFKPHQQDHAISTSQYDASWKLVSITYFDDQGHKTSINVAGDNGINTVTSFVPGTEQIAKVDVYSNWKLESRTSYDANGKIVSIEKNNADGTHEVQNFTSDHTADSGATEKLLASPVASAAHKSVSVDFLVHDSGVDTSHIQQIEAATDAASQHSNADTTEHSAAESHGQAHFETADGVIITDVPTLDNHIFNSTHDNSVVVPHYDLT